MILSFIRLKLRQLYGLCVRTAKRVGKHDWLWTLLHYTAWLFYCCMLASFRSIISGTQWYICLWAPVVFWSWSYSAKSHGVRYALGGAAGLEIGRAHV